MDEKVDVAIIGGGVIGCAVASAVAGGNRSVFVLEAGPRIAEGVTSRNSGVIHSGLYYAAGSLKAVSCVEGNRAIYDWAAKKDVAHAKTGKLVVAAVAQLGALEKLLANARANGAPGVERIGRASILAKEPALAASGWEEAIWCPETGIVDAYELARSLLIDAESRGAQLFTHAAVTAITRAPGGWMLETTRGPIGAERVVNAAGLGADEVAAMSGARSYRIHPCRGDYFSLSTNARYTRLVYPMKHAASPGLGLHLTIDLAGRLRIGPDAQYVSAKDDFRPAESKRETFRTAAEELLGGPVSADQLQYDSCGIRPKLRGPKDHSEVDFVVAEDAPGFVNMIGIESPGLTAAIALAKRVAALVT